jgi:hypothetical protein
MRLAPVADALAVVIATFTMYLALRFSDVTGWLDLRDRFNKKVLIQGVLCATFAAVLLIASRQLGHSVTPFIVMIGLGFVVFSRESDLSRRDLVALAVAFVGTLIFQLGTMGFVPYGTWIGWCVCGVAGSVFLLVPDASETRKRSQPKPLE